ncbi:MAG: hypothetical protein ACREEM_07530 [Blastocatellia bacterium]
MKKVLLGTLLFVTMLGANPALAQNPNTSDGPVWRLIYYRINPGQEAASWKDFRENAKPIFEQAKKEGVFLDYKIFQNPLKDRPDDWDVLLAIALPNYAMLDQLEAKAAALYNKHYGSPDAAAAAARKRGELREVITMRLAREVLLK